MKTLKERIKSAREDAGLTKAELARRSGVSRSTITQWENGSIKNIEGRHLVKASEALNVREKWLSDGTGHRSKTEKQEAPQKAKPTEFKVEEPAQHYSDDMATLMLKTINKEFVKLPPESQHAVMQALFEEIKKTAGSKHDRDTDTN